LHRAARTEQAGAANSLERLLKLSSTYHCLDFLPKKFGKWMASG